MDDISNLRLADIFLAQNTLVGFHDHADLNFLGLFLGA
jgi:hypothetical protein